MTNGSPISVIVPAYNAAGFISTCLDSVLAQTRRPAEVIVVDDGSVDATETVVRQYGNGVRYRHQANRGPSAARNVGLELAEYPLVAFLDADDFWREAFLETCESFLDAHSDTIAVGTGLAIRNAGGRETVLPRGLEDGDFGVEPYVVEDFFAMWAAHDHVRTGSSLFRRDALLRAGGFREDLRVAEDLELWGYLATLGKWGFVPAPLWVGNSHAAAAAVHRTKMGQRGRMCPTVEQWQQRLAPRIPPDAQDCFAIVRGRVAAAFAYFKVLGGDQRGARHIVMRYGPKMPRSHVRTLLRGGVALGLPGWWLVGAVIKLYEVMKSARLRKLARTPGRRIALPDKREVAKKF